MDDEEFCEELSRHTLRSKMQTMELFSLVGNDRSFMLELENRLKNCHVHYCPGNEEAVNRVMAIAPQSEWFDVRQKMAPGS